MKHENLFKIYIPEPCNEDWDKMNPNEQGAFCKVCSKTVVDFSSKADNEVQKFLSENLDKKICGRFKVDQLAEIPRLKIMPRKIDIPKFLFPISYSPVRAFAMALILFASVALASCGNSETGGGGGESDSTKVERLTGGATIQIKNDTANEHKDINENINPNNIPDPVLWNMRTMGAVNYEKIKENTCAPVDSSETKNQNDSTQINNRNQVKIGKMEYMKGDMQIEK